MHIDTKYYSADIQLFTTVQKELVNKDFAESVQAAILHFDTSQESTFDNVKTWMPFIKEYRPEVQILACDRLERENSVLSRSFVLEWCIKNGFELVELDPEDESDEEDDFKETKGYPRILQALHAHLWPNMTTKEYNPGTSSRNQEMVKEDCIDTGGITTDIKNKMTIGQASIANGNSSSGTQVEVGSERREEEVDVLVEDEIKVLENLVGNEDPGGESFEALFSKFHNMKQKAATLSGEDRKKYAEKVAVAFWRALGGDEEEVAGLSSEED
ncbi:alpha- and gamma-adaptin-binding protein p34-like isoform X1 [Limulus polyphemus]|uniref:Alpha- and gamma-adaptin-binding protein p34-like isoform X1 n=1 Tax=Limulus polyphemus TaxID=6850 RepID=A0ABM1C0P1_LIMPO|nr:alpha- and gamma-adaptin-binding protein p34-like isoform X1 [Limulus polyphemus]